MPNFKYVAVSDTGQVKCGSVLADSAARARETLRDQGWFVTRLRREWWDLRPADQALVPAELIAISRELATLLRGKVTLPSALDVLAANAKGRSSAVLLKVKAAIEEGASPSAAFAAQGAAFEATFLQMVSLGEKSGELAGALDQYTSYLRRINELRRRVIQASYYPAILLVVITVAVSILLLFSVPRFAQMYEDLGAPLPALTEALLVLSSYFPFLLGVLVIAVAAGLLFRGGWYQALRRAPLFRHLAAGYERARFTRSMAMLLASGMNAVAALETTAEMLKRGAGARLHAAARHIAAGTSFSKAVAETGLLSPTGLKIIEVAEHTGTLPAQTAAIAEFYEEDLDHAVARAVAIIEPVMILAMGVVVGAIVLAMYMPIFSLAAAIR